MSSWSAGYVLDVPYTSGFYRELAPSYLQFVLSATAGVRTPRLDRPFTYCELACGQGFGTALLAAANPNGTFWGLDFNAAQISNARRLAAEAGLTNVQFLDQSFEESVNAPIGTFPQFDFITLHGIYSWINPENRDFIARFLGDRLKPGGIVYVSYNCLPGWSTAAPLQRLMREHANRHPDRSDLQAKAALAFAEQLRVGGARFFTTNPSLAPRMEKMPELNSNYLAHEYLNGHWHPLYHLDVARELDPARLTYACSATITENMAALTLPTELQELGEQTRDRAWLETIRDFAANRQFRRDIFMRGVSEMPSRELMAMLGHLRIALINPAYDQEFKLQGPLGEVAGQKALYQPLLEALSIQTQTVGTLAQLPAFADKPFAMLLQALQLLIHTNVVLPLPYELKGKSADVARAFNRAITSRLRVGETYNFLASAAAGTGIAASYAEQMACLALTENPRIDARAFPAFAWPIMQQTGQRLVKEGRTLETEAENLAELEAQAQMIWNLKLPIWRTLGVV